jgi:hypothetical protein
MVSPGIARARELLAKDRSRRSYFSCHPSSCKCDDCAVRKYLELTLDSLEALFDEIDWMDIHSDAVDVVNRFDEHRENGA